MFKQELVAALKTDEALRKALGARSGVDGLAEAKRLFTEMDTDKSGNISWNEYRE